MNRQPVPLHIHLDKSPRLYQYQQLLHAAIFVYLLAASIFYPVILISALLIFYSWCRLLVHNARKNGDKVLIVWDADGVWSVTDEQGRCKRYPGLGGCFTTHWLTILRFRCGYLKSRYYLLLKDNCDPEQFRRLRVRLKHSLIPVSEMADNYRVSGP